VEENALEGGFGSSIVKFLQGSGIHDVPVKSLGIPDEFVDQGTQTVLRAKYGLDTKGIIQQVRNLLSDHSTASSPKVKGEVGTTPF